MYFEETPLRIERNKLKLVASILGLHPEKYKTEVLAVAVANRFKHKTLSDKYYDNPTDIEIVGSKDSLYFVELKYVSPMPGWSKQEFVYCVDVKKQEGFFIKDRRIKKKANSRIITLVEGEPIEIL